METILEEMTARCEVLRGRIPPEQAAWFKRKLSELYYHTNRMFAE